jgi:hypothetical protein
MEQYYKDPSLPASFSGVNKIARHSKNKNKIVSKNLNKIDSYALHKPLKRRFKRSRVVVGGINNQFESDLFDLTRYRKWNSGYGYILIVIDAFSRYLMVQPLKTKKALEVCNALKKILKNNSCYNIHTDAGGEYLSRVLGSFLKEKSIKHFIARNTETKACIAERVIRTISKKLFRYFSEKNTYNWVDVIQDIVTSYNKTFHRSIGMAPIAVTKNNEAAIWRRLYLTDSQPPRDYKFNVNDVVRISVLKGNFKKERDENFTRELFIITERYRSSGIPLYKLKDWNGDLLLGSFYEEEVQRVRVDDATEYKIDKVIRKRVKRGKKQLLVHWLGWPSSFDSWIDAELVK